MKSHSKKYEKLKLGGSHVLFICGLFNDAVSSKYSYIYTDVDGVNHRTINPLKPNLV
jgi:hypothetical protein